MKKTHSQNSGMGREWKNLFPKFGNGKGMKKIHSHNSGMGIQCLWGAFLDDIFSGNPRLMFAYCLQCVKIHRESEQCSLGIYSHHKLLHSWIFMYRAQLRHSLSSWSPNSTVLHLDIYLLCKYTTLLLHSRAICYSLSEEEHSFLMCQDIGIAEHQIFALLLEHKTCNILAAERLRLMRFDNWLIINSFQNTVCVLKW